MPGSSTDFAAGEQMLPRSDAQEDLASVQEAGERDRKNEPEHIGNEGSGAVGDGPIEKGHDIPAHKASRERLETDHAIEKIKGACVRAHPDEDRRPGLVSPYAD